jgi:ferredoxin
MGVAAETVAERKALVRCGGTREKCKLSFEYRGEQTCEAASLLYSGQKQCNYGCLGFGDCAAVCPHGAIAVQDGVAFVDQDRCFGCALCVAACPKNIITITETRGKAINRCCSQAPGPLVRRHCAAGCIGCRLCEKNCPEHAITVANNLAYVDPAKCTGCGLCQQKCPTKCLLIQSEQSR